MRISELQREERLLIIEEARLLRDRDQVDDAIQRDVDIKALLVWNDTRQGYKYWFKLYSTK
jgi:hypothetical protein